MKFAKDIAGTVMALFLIAIALIVFWGLQKIWPDQYITEITKKKSAP